MPNSQLMQMIETDMVEVEKGYAVPRLVENRIRQYIHHYGIDDFISGFTDRYDKTIGEEHEW